MAIKINEDNMTATIDGAEIATATRVDGRWILNTWPRVLTYNQAMTSCDDYPRLGLVTHSRAFAIDFSRPGRLYEKSCL
jgi:hypothetical protein